jgi:acyl-CoA thioesterase
MDNAAATFRGDRLIQEFGIDLREVGEGYARVSVTVQERFLNSHGIAHGALQFAVADAAFAVAANTAVEAVGVQWNLSVFRAARLGEELIGEARVVHRGRHLLVCELSVTTADGRLLARGQATALPATRESYRQIDLNNRS